MASVRRFLASFSAAKIPRNDFEYVFSRSSGPGGQNVNKVNSKATIRCSKENWDRAAWLPAEVKDLLRQQDFPYQTKSGAVLVSSELTRSQKLNLADCFYKLTVAIKNASFVPEEPSTEDKHRWAEIRAREANKRLELKKQHSMKKSSRRESL